MAKLKGPAGEVIIAGACSMAALMGLVFLVVGASSWREARASAGWPGAPGVVTEARVHDRTGRKHGRATHLYSGEIRYEFEVAGRRYHGSRLGVTGSSSGDRGRAEAVVARYPVGKAVTVHYDPADPARCCLHPGDTGGSLVFVVAGAVMAGLGGLFTTLVVRRLRAAPAT